MHEEWCQKVAEKLEALETKVNQDKKIVLSPSIPFTLYLPSMGIDAAFMFPTDGRVSRLLVQVPDLEQKQQVTVHVEVSTGTQLITNSINVQKGLTTLGQDIKVKPGTVVRAKFTSETPGMYVVVGGVYENRSFHIALKDAEVTDAGISS